MQTTGTKQKKLLSKSNRTKSKTNHNIKNRRTAHQQNALKRKVVPPAQQRLVLMKRRKPNTQTKTRKMKKVDLRYSFARKVIFPFVHYLPTLFLSLLKRIKERLL
ncbi:hypothetical protein QUF79_13300 [Fictibacillus enclensis]|nr:hypothetical protein [Fictibacillus enclensis]